MFIRIRLIPITIVFVILMLVFRMGNIWNGMDAAQVAQAVPSIPAVSELNGDRQNSINLRQSVFSSDSGDQPSTPAVVLADIISDAQAQQATENNVAANTEDGKVYSDTTEAAPRLVDLADIPLRDDPNTEGLKPLSLITTDINEQDIVDVNTLSVAEVRLLHTLADRRRRLDSRERALIERESVISAAEQQLNTQQLELEEIRAEIRRNLQIHDERQEQQIVQMREVYSTMTPKQAAQIFNELDMDILVNVIRGMTARKIAPIIGLMNVQKARDVTLRLADRTSYGIPE